MADTQILILGGGPAGAAVAIALQGLGYRVTLVSQPRPFASLEGVSERVVEAMRNAGFLSALAHLAEPSRRDVTWNGVSSAANSERLIERRRFDAALLDDLDACGVGVIRARVDGVQHDAGGVRARLHSEAGERSIRAEFLVEARGRAAPKAGGTVVRSAETVALLQRWYGLPGSACSAVQSLAEGWVWMARHSDGVRYLQLTVDVASAQLPPKTELGDWCRQKFDSLQRARPFIDGANPIGPVYARTSTQVLYDRLSGPNWIRVGDAAMAVDPMSGNGIFQALSSALQAPAVINTLLQRPERAELAHRFYRQRVEGLFYRFARTGRDFCCLEQQWSQQPFWAARRGWPDDRPLHLPVTPEQVAIARCPVISNNLIAEAEVVTTPDQPLGIWHLNGIELAPLLSRIRSQAQPALTTLIEQLGESRGRALAQWLAQQGMIAPG